MGIRLYNKMSTKIKQWKCFTDFKQRLKVFVVNHPFHSLNGFFTFYIHVFSVLGLFDLCKCYSCSKQMMNK